MFTGIVAEAGVIEKITPTAKAIEMTVRAGADARGVKVGDSVAVNGCCLTAVKVAARGKGKAIQFDLLQESWKRTNFQFARPGSLVNLERPLRANGELWPGWGRSFAGSEQARTMCWTFRRRRR
jgi:riboflavin synthase